MRLRSIDLLRAVAACAVVMRHSLDSFYIGAAGVDLFFVISGFVIASVSTGRSASEFLLDRASRIFPVFWIALLCWGILSSYSGAAFDLKQLPIDLFLVPLLFVDKEPLFYLSWSLVFEALFYCCAAACIRLNSAKPIFATFGVLMLASAVTGWSYLKWVGSPIIFEFLFGVLIFRAPKVARVGLPALLLGATLLVTSPPIERDVFEFFSALTRVTRWGIPAALIVYGFVTLEHRLTWPIVDRLCWIGMASYSIYLFHPLAAGKVLDPWWATFVLGVSSGVVAWALFERNLEKIRRHWRRTSQGRIGSTAASPA
jgi:exopolysaccharide production protein ExoZ